MRLLTVPNWSFGRDKDLLNLLKELLTGWDLTLHFAASDVDHNRTVTAFSGPPETVFERLERLAEAVFERVDLNRHSGVHPRIGALDVCPFVRLDEEPYPLQESIEQFCARLAEKHDLPIFLYESSEKGRHAYDLPSLRNAGFGGLMLESWLPTDFGPTVVNKRLGASVVGERPFLIAMNVNLRTEVLAIAKRIARDIRDRRKDGEVEFTGVRALGFPLPSRELVQVSMNLTQPDVTSPDHMVEFVMDKARRQGIAIANCELIGVIRDRDCERATHIPMAPNQIVEWNRT